MPELPGKVPNCYAHRSGGGKYMAVLQCKRAVHTDEGKQLICAICMRPGPLGAIILPPVPAYYTRPQTMEDCTRHTVNRILSQFDLDEGSYQWARALSEAGYRPAVVVAGIHYDNLSKEKS